MAQRGRPRGLNINPVAVEELMEREGLSHADLCRAAAPLTAGHLADMLRRQKGASPAIVGRLAEALRCRRETIAPELLQRPRFVVVRVDDVDLPEAC